MTASMIGFGLTENGTGSSPPPRSVSSVTIESLPPPTADSGRPSVSSGRAGTGAATPATTGTSESTCGRSLRYAYSARPLV